jgi:HPt (histidine-containing phosphotransfer) domain-containing protein
MEDTINSQELWDRLGDDRALLSELLDDFRQDYPAQIQAVGEALACEDSPGVQHAAHSLKGTLGNLAATVGYRLAAKLEDIGRSGQLAQANSVLTELEQELSRVTTALDILCHGADTRVGHLRSSS